MSTPVLHFVGHLFHTQLFALFFTRLASLCSLLLLAVCTSWSQPQLLKTFTPNGVSAGSSPQYVTTAGNQLFFSANDGELGFELWKSDGTAEGTVLVKDVWPGERNSNPKDLTNVNGQLFFTVDDPAYGRELWKSDGTESGTVMVKDILPGGNSYWVGRLTAIQHLLYFTVDTGSTIYLWRSDGSEAGTFALTKLYEGRSSLFFPHLTYLNGSVYFAASDPAHGYELWKTDGTSSGTVLVKDISPGNLGSYPQEFTVVNGLLYFTAIDESLRNTIWKSDGTENGTVKIIDVNIAYFRVSTPHLVGFKESLYFISEDNFTSKGTLWKSDGTESGTIAIKEISPRSFVSYYLSAIGDFMYFITPNEDKVDLWKSDGTTEGSSIVKSGITIIDDYQAPLMNWMNTLYFVASTPENGPELWKSNGTADGTRLVKDINPGVSSGINFFKYYNFTEFSNALYFAADNGNQGIELWKSDGTETGTTLLKDINRKVSHTFAFASVGQSVYFRANDGISGSEFWKSNGTSAGTVLVKDINPGPGSSAPYSININGTLYLFATDEEHGRELWKSDGTAVGTTLLKDIYPGKNSGIPLGFATSENLILAALGNTLLFGANNGVNGVELWKSDGTSGGTSMVKDIYSGPYNAYPYIMTPINNTLFFSADDQDTGVQLWKSDGTKEGTVIVKKIGNWFSFPYYLTNVNGLLYFSASDDTHGQELWKSDGTEAGTTLVKDITPGPSGTSYSDFSTLNGKLLFVVTNDSNGRELWQSDGTEAGTTLLKDIHPGNQSACPEQLVKVGNVIYFRAFTQANGIELWKTDGTAQGTVLVKDIAAGAVSSAPYGLTNVNGMLYFVAYTPATGYELWKSDGTAAGTVLVADLNPGTGSSFINSLTYANGILYFSADDSINHTGLWSFDLNACTSALNTLLTVTGSTVCENSNATITISNSQTGVQYQIFQQGKAIGKVAQGGGTISLTIPTAQLGAGKHSLTIRARSCQEVTLANQALVEVSGAPSTAPGVSTIVPINAGQTATLTASGGSEGTYRWYTQAAGGTAIPNATDASYTTPLLWTSTDYYVAIANNCGESSRTKIGITVNKQSQTINFTPIAAQLVGNPPIPLVATASSGLSVEFSVVSGPATITANLLSVTGPGTVTVRASQEGNETYDAASAEQRFVVSAITALEPTWSEEVLVYPNPASQQVTVVLPERLRNAALTFMNSQGKVVTNQPVKGSRSIEVPVAQLPKGIYLLRIQYGSDNLFRKVVIE